MQDLPVAEIPLRDDLARDAPDAARADRRAGVLGAFNLVDRVADGTGLPLDDRLIAVSGDVRRELDLSRFGSAANTLEGI